MINIKAIIEDYYFNCECCGGGNSVSGEFVFENEQYNFMYDGHLGSVYKGKDNKHNINLYSTSDLLSGTEEVLFNLIKLITEKENKKVAFYPLGYAKERVWKNYKNDNEEEKYFNDIFKKSKVSTSVRSIENNNYEQFILILDENEKILYFETVKSEYYCEEDKSITSLTKTFLNTLKFLGYNVELILKEEY